MKLDHLPPEELAVVKWQFGIYGHFFTALWKAIEFADEGNLMLLARAFPTEVNGYLQYTRQKGWWTRVKATLDIQE